MQRERERAYKEDWELVVVEREGTGNGNDDDDMLSDEEEVVGPLKIFSLHLVNSYGNAQLEPIDSTAGRLSALFLFV